MSYKVQVQVWDTSLD